MFRRIAHKILSSKALIKFLRWCFGSALVTKNIGSISEPALMSDRMFLVLKKEGEEGGDSNTKRDSGN